MPSAGRRPRAPPPAAPAQPPAAPAELPMATSAFAEVSRPVGRAPPPEPQDVAVGVVVFDVDGTLLDDLGLISHVAGDVMHQAFGTPVEEGRVHYLATTGMPFEAQLAQLYPEAPAEVRRQAAALFHQRKVREAYTEARPFPEVPRVLKRLADDRWTLTVSTGAETEMADLLLEREGLRYWFEAVLGSAEGTKREHLQEYHRRYPRAPLFLVGDSRFDMECVDAVPGTRAVGRASSLHGWGLTPSDLKRWGAAWADYSLSGLPEALGQLRREPTDARRPARRRAR